MINTFGDREVTTTNVYKTSSDLREAVKLSDYRVIKISNASKVSLVTFDVHRWLTRNIINYRPKCVCVCVRSHRIFVRHIIECLVTITIGSRRQDETQNARYDIYTLLLYSLLLNFPILSKFSTRIENDDKEIGESRKSVILLTFLLDHSMSTYRTRFSCACNFAVT